MKLSYLLLFLFVITITACEDDDDIIDVITGNEPVNVTGLTYAENEDDALPTIYNDIVADLNAAGPISVVAQVDHEANARNNGLTLRPTRVVMFGNPTLGTPLMVQNMQAGLDLPQKILVYQASDDDVIVAYNSTRYLASRHGLTDDGELTMIGNALQMFVENNTGESVQNSSDVEVEAGEGIVEVTYDRPIDDVYNGIKGAIESNANLTLVAELDHQANAARVGLTLNPSRLLVFGNPNLGTPLMQDEQTVAIDLPQKILVYQDDANVTHVIYNDPAFLKDRHDLGDDVDEQLTMITNALANLAAAGGN